MHAITENLFCFCLAEVLVTNPVNKNCLVLASSTALLGFHFAEGFATFQQNCNWACLCRRGEGGLPRHMALGAAATQEPATFCLPASQLGCVLLQTERQGFGFFLLHLARITAGTLQPKPSHHKDPEPLREVEMPQGQELAFHTSEQIMPREKRALEHSLRHKAHGLCSKYLLCEMEVRKHLSMLLSSFW